MGTTQARWITAAIAGLAFALFAVAVVSFRGAFRVNATDLGVSVWTARQPTESRLQPLIDDALNAKALTSWIWKHTQDVNVVSTDNPPEDPPPIWDALDAIAEALTADEARARLASLWAREMRGDDTEAAIQGAMRQYLRAGLEASASGGVPSQSTAANEVINGIAKEYGAGLGRAIPRWLDVIMPAPAIHGFLKDEEVVATADPTRFTAQVHDAITAFLLSRHRETDIGAAVEAEIEISASNASLLKAVEQDFSARWMWTIAAAVFLTAAVSAILGAAWYVWTLAGPRHRVWPILAYGLFVAAGMIYGLMASTQLPPFLSAPLQEFTTSYEIVLAGSALLLRAVGAAAVGALLVASWGSFLLDTRDDRHLETQLATLRWSFHAATFVLVAGVLYLYAFLQWPSSFIGEGAAAMVQSGARASALSLGAVFSTLLLLMYVPGANALVAEARSRQAEAAANGDETRRTSIDDMLTRQGFDSSATQQIARFAQVFLPLIVAPIGAELITLIAS